MRDPGCSVSEHPHAGCPGAAQLFGYRARSLLICVRIRSSPLSSINQPPRSHRNCDLPTLTVKCFVQIKPAEQPKPVERPTQLCTLAADTQTTNSANSSRTRPAPCRGCLVIISALTCPLFGWRAVSFGWTASSSCVFVRYHREVEPLHISHW